MHHYLSSQEHRDHAIARAKRLVQPLDPMELVPLVTRLWYSGHEVYAVCKQIDGIPNVEGTYTLAGNRAARFLWQRHRQIFYEPVGDPELIRQQLFF